MTVVIDTPPAPLVPDATLWYIARGTGFVAVVMLTVSVALGILTTMRWSAPRWPRFVTATLHKNISLLSVAFLATHIATAPADAVNGAVDFNLPPPLASPKKGSVYTGGYTEPVGGRQKRK